MAKKKDKQKKSGVQGQDTSAVTQRVLDVPDLRVRFIENAEKSQRITDTTPPGIIRKVLKDDKTG